jgi:signal transduction histidine kinase
MNIAGREPLVALGNEPAATSIVIVPGVSARSEIKSQGGRLNFPTYWIAVSLALVCGTILLAGWMAAHIEADIIDNFAADAAHYIDTLISRHLQELASTSDVSEERKRALDALMSSDAMRERIVTVRIWKDDIVVYSSRKQDIKNRSQPTEALARARNGQVAGQLDHSTDRHNPVALAFGFPVLELYTPVREQGSGRIIAIAEVHEIAPALKNELLRVQLQAWLPVGAIALAIIALSYGIVLNGGWKIARQRSLLQQQPAEFSPTPAESEGMHGLLDQVNERLSESDRRFLRGIGADLHDGPLQLLALALMRLDEVRDALTNAKCDVSEGPDQIGSIRRLLTEAMQDIRHISAGLGPPDVDDASLREALQMAAQSHQRRTGTSVRCEFSGGDRHVTSPLKVCIYRFVQEALSNAYRHAGGRGQAVMASCDDSEVEVSVVDEGPGLAASMGTSSSGQGLSGLCERIESLGGAFEVYSIPGEGTRLTARFEILPKGHRPDRSPLH